MTARVFRRIFFAIIISMLVTCVTVLFISHSYIVEKLSDEIRNEAVYVAGGIEMAGEEYLDSFDSDRRITWVAGDGSVIYDNMYSVADMGDHSEREEIIEAKEKGFGSVIRYSKTIRADNIYQAVRLEDGSVVRISSECPTIWALLESLLNPLLMLVALSVAVSFVVSRHMAKRTLRPINNIDLDNPDEKSCYQELKPLITKMRRQNSFIQSQIADLGRKQEEFSVITENMSEGFIVANCRREILSYNASAISVLGAGLSAEKPVVDTLRYSDIFVSAVNTALQGKHNEQGLEVDGAYYRIIANPVYHNGEISGVVIVILDVTEKENRDKMRREFTSNVSHELKTPLTSIKGAAELMLGGLVKPEDEKAFSQTIYEESNRLMALIDDILRLSQLDETEIVLEKTEIDLHEACSSVIERLSDSAAKLNVSMTLEGEKEIVLGVPTIIDEMIYNLCDNAVKYNVNGGSVAVAVGRKDGKPMVRVSDTGIGIPKEHIGRIFERFYRVDKSRSKAIGGTGLGLSIVKHAANRHDADVLIESEEGKGTTITVLFGGGQPGA